MQTGPNNIEYYFSEVSFFLLWPVTAFLSVCSKPIAESPFFYGAQQQRTWTMCGQSAKQSALKKKRKKLAAAEVFKVTDHQQPFQIVSPLAAILMRFQSVKSIAATAPV